VLGDADHDPPGEEDGDDDHDDDLGDDGDGLVLDGGDRLQDADDEAHEDARREDRGGDLEGDDQGVLDHLDGRGVEGHRDSGQASQGMTRWRASLAWLRRAVAASGAAEGWAKLRIRLPTMSCQPSTRTKRRSLKGSEIMTGGSIIMLIEMRMELMTMSMT